MSSDKIYCGNGKEKFFNNGGSIIEVTLDVDVLARNFNEHGFTSNGQNPSRKIKVKIAARREVDSYGNSHYVEIDTWKPNQNGQQGGYQQPQQGPPPQQAPQGQGYPQGPPQGPPQGNQYPSGVHDNRPGQGYQNTQPPGYAGGNGPAPVPGNGGGPTPNPSSPTGFEDDIPF